jgi:hypothetical protein
MIFKNQMFRLIEELRFHQMESAELVSEKQKLVAELTIAKREISIFGDQEVEYAKQAHLRYGVVM